MSGLEYCISIEEAGFCFARRLASNFWEVLIRGAERYDGWLVDMRNSAGLSGGMPVQINIPLSSVQIIWLEDLGPAFTQRDYADQCARAVGDDIDNLQIDIVRSRSGDMICLAANLSALKSLAHEFELSGFLPRSFVVLLNGEDAERDACFYPTVAGVVPAKVKAKGTHMRMIDAPHVQELSPNRATTDAEPPLQPTVVCADAKVEACSPKPETMAPDFEPTDLPIENEASVIAAEDNLAATAPSVTEVVLAEPSTPDTSAFSVSVPQTLATSIERPPVFVTGVKDCTVSHLAFQLVLLALGKETNTHSVHVFDRCDKFGRSTLTLAIGYGTDHGSSDDLLLSKRAGDLSAGLKRYDSCAADIFGPGRLVFLSPFEVSHILNWAERRNARAISTQLRFPPVSFLIACMAHPEEIKDLRKNFEDLLAQPRFPAFRPFAMVFDHCSAPTDSVASREMENLARCGINVVRIPYLKTDIVATAYASGMSIEALLEIDLEDVALKLSVSEWEAHSGLIELSSWKNQCMDVLESARLLG